MLELAQIKNYIILEYSIHEYLKRLNPFFSFFMPIAGQWYIATSAQFGHEFFMYIFADCEGILKHEHKCYDYYIKSCISSTTDIPDP